MACENVLPSRPSPPAGRGLGAAPCSNAPHTVRVTAAPHRRSLQPPARHRPRHGDTTAPESPLRVTSPQTAGSAAGLAQRWLCRRHRGASSNGRGGEGRGGAGGAARRGAVAAGGQRAPSVRGGTGPGDGRHRERGPCRPPGESCAALCHGSSIPRRRRGDCGLVAALQAGGGWGGGEGGCIRVYLRLFRDDDACFGLGFFCSWVWWCFHFSPERWLRRRWLWCCSCIPFCAVCVQSRMLTAARVV